MVLPLPCVWDALGKPQAVNNSKDLTENLNRRCISFSLTTLGHATTLGEAALARICRTAYYGQPSARWRIPYTTARDEDGCSLLPRVNGFVEAVSHSPGCHLSSRPKTELAQNVVHMDASRAFRDDE